MTEPIDTRSRAVCSSIAAARVPNWSFTAVYTLDPLFPEHTCDFQLHFHRHLCMGVVDQSLLFWDIAIQVAERNGVDEVNLLIQTQSLSLD